MKTSTVRTISSSERFIESDVNLCRPCKMPRGIATCQMSAIEKPSTSTGIGDPRCSKTATGRASKLVTSTATRHGIAISRLVRVSRVRAQDAAGDGVIDEPTDARDQTTREEDHVLPDQPVLAELNQALPELRSGAGLHGPPDCTQGVA